MANKLPIRVDISVSSQSEPHAMAAGMIIARVLARAGITYIVLEGDRTDTEISEADMISESEIVFQIVAPKNSN